METSRRMPMWGWIALAGGCGLLLVCLCVAAVGGGLLFLQPAIGVAPAPQPVIQTQPRPVNRIAYQGTDGNIYTIAPDGSDAKALTTDGESGDQAQRINRTPTWSPDGRQVAFVKVSRAGGGFESLLQAAAVETGAVETLHTVNGSGPFYLFWAPDSRQLAFLESVGQTIALRLARLGQTQAQEMGRGSPFYYDWAPDSQRLLFHVDGVKPSPSARVSLVQPGQSEPPPLSSDPALFLAPDWSPDGKWLAYARRAPNNLDEVVVTNADGSDPRPAITYRGLVSFAWSPQSDQLAYIVTASPEAQGLGQIAFGPLALTDPTGANPRVVSQDDVLSFFWSPDGASIATLTLYEDPQTGETSLLWKVIDVASGDAHEVTRFDPSEEFVSLIPFFDQYARSLRVWSPDSRSLVYAVDEGQDHYGIYVVDVVPGSQPRRLADGVTAGWSWR